MSIPEKYVGSALAVAITAIVIVTLRKKRGSKHPPYPPGPKGYPVIGNVLDFPQNPIWEGFAKMCQEYGEFIAPSDSLLRLWLFLTLGGCRY